MVASYRTWGRCGSSAGTNVSVLGGRRAAVTLFLLKNSLNGRPYIRTGREREGHGGAVEPETAQGLLCGGVQLVVRSWDACLIDDGDYF